MVCNVTHAQKCRCGKKVKAKAKTEQDVKGMFRKLFSDHSWYTYVYIVAVIYKLPSAKELQRRLLDNQREIGNEIGNLKGEKNGKAVTKLLKQHILAADFVLQTALKDQDVKVSVQALYAQGNQVAQGLSQILNASEPVFTREFHMHNAHVVKIATLLLKSKPIVKALDAYQNHMLHFSDLLHAHL